MATMVALGGASWACHQRIAHRKALAPEPVSQA
jgi:hypothetical protein